MEKSRLLVVLGVPRSGTSAITRALKIFGASFGQDLIEAKQDINDKGFWEDKEILNLNEDILRTLNTSWSSLKPITKDCFDSDEFTKYKVEAESLIKDKVRNGRILALKEPRITKLLPFWEMIFESCGISVSYIVALRHPSGVLNSFIRQENVMVRSVDIIPSNVYLIWLSYLVATIPLFLSKSDVMVVSYNDLLDDPQGVIFSLSRKLNIDVDETELVEYSQSFLSKELNHARGDNNFSGDFNGIIIDLYNVLLEVSRNTATSCSQEQIKALEIIKCSFDNISSFLPLADHYREALFSEICSNRYLSDENEEKEKLIYDKNCYINELKSKLSVNYSEIETQRREIEIKDRKALEYNDEISRILNSKSMKITKPLRLLTAFVNRVKGK
ncbi:sulfotransferase family protein [Vibrio rumoiensis]|uniref:sulfotransferase family protein n=1 Tax=Vibrio rumoiensis TaxID=76258 RepID=UPI003748E240